MSIVRTVHNKENPYAQLSKKVINDNNISLESLGLWTWCMSKPNDWTFHVQNIATERKISKKCVYKIIKELIENSYCFRFQQRTQTHGKFAEYEYFFFEYKPDKKDIKEILDLYPNLHSPELKKIKDSSPCSQNGHAVEEADSSQEKPPHVECAPFAHLPHAANPLSGFGHLTNDTNEMKKDIKANDINESVIAPVPEVIESLAFIPEGKVSESKWLKSLPQEKLPAYHWLKSQNLDTDDDTLCFFARQYPLERLKSAYQESIDYRANNVVGYMRKLLKEERQLRNPQTEENRIFAEWYRDNCFPSLQIDKLFVFADLANGSRAEYRLDCDALQFKLNIQKLEALYEGNRGA